MPRNFSRGLRAIGWWRIALGALAVATGTAAWIATHPPGGSAEDLKQQLGILETQVAAKRALLASTRQHVTAVAQGRAEGDKFLSEYFLARRTAYSTLLTELVAAADEAMIKPKEHAYSTEPIEGSDTLSMMSISANYEGTYANLMRFVHELDRSPRLLIIEALNAAPQATGGTLNISMKIDTFVREDGLEP
jgi:hypothetical protein